MKIVSFAHQQYEKLSDDVYRIGANTILRMNVLLARKLEDGSRSSYHKEYEYGSSKYSNVSYNLVSLRRNFDYFLTIENFKKTEVDKEYIMLRAEDMYYILNQFKTAYRWFTDIAFKDLYAYDKNNKLIICKRPDTVYISNLAMDKYMSLDPIVLEYANGVQQYGIRLTLSNPANYVDIGIPRFEGLLYTLTTFNMFQSAQNMVNYLQRPELGTNSYSFNTTQEPSITEGVVGGSRQIPSKKKSFFDKMNDL